MDIESMAIDEIKKKIIRMIKEIDDIQILEKIYHFVKSLVRLEENES